MGLPLALASLVGVVPLASALETDQFTIGREPIADLGPAFTEYLRKELEEAAADANRSKVGGRHLKLIDEVDDEIGGAMMGKAEKWCNARREAYGVARGESIYGLAGFARPVMMLLEFAPTVNIYGAEFGTDKLGHFVRQGKFNIQLYYQRLDKGDTVEQARAYVRGRGKAMEDGMWGMTPSGTYSNGDLAANYAGFRFMQNLTEAITVNGKVYPPIYVVAGGRYKLNPELDLVETVKLFISEHLGEAFNPSVYAREMQSPIRKALKERCAAWRARDPRLTPESDRARVERLSTWYGEKYGHWMSPNLITLGNTCF